jgi:deazaflavin-dependent oxidoreductase (nitroreductase family)
MSSATYLHGAAHVKRYLETNGQDGFHWRNGTTILILFTRGRKSGTERSHALIFREHGDDYLVVASKGGADKPPTWFRNLLADPNVEVQIKGDRFRATARAAGPTEKPEMWAKMVEVWPAYDDYQKKTSRDIAVVVLHRAESG